MAEISYTHNESEGANTTTSTSFGNINSNLAVTGANLSANSEYFFCSWMLINGNDGNSAHYEFKMTDDSGADLTGSFALVEPRRVSTAFGHHWFYMHRYTFGASPGNLDQEYRVNTGGSTAANTYGGSVALEIGGAGLTVNTDFFWDEDTTSYTSLSSSAWQDGASITIGNGSDDYLLFFNLHILVNSTSQGIRFRLSIGGSTEKYFEFEGEDTSEEWAMGGYMPIAAPAASTTVTLQFQTTSASAGAMDVDRNCIAAIRLNRFKQHTIGSMSATATMSAANTYYEVITNRLYAPAKNLDNLLVWHSGQTWAGDANKIFWQRISDREATPFNEPGGVLPNNGADRLSILGVIHDTSNTASTTLSFDVEYQNTNSDVAPPPEIWQSWITVMSTELTAAAVTDRSVCATFSALVITEQAATVNRKRNANATAQALLLSEQAASVNRKRQVNAQTQALAITEATAALNRTRTLAAGVQILSIAGQAATIDFGKTVAATIQALTISEYTATINRMRGVAATSQALALTEQAATVSLLLNRVISAEVQALSITAYQATINASRLLAATAQALSITEFPATISTDPPWSTVTDKDASGVWSAVADGTGSWSMGATTTTTWGAVADAADTWTQVSDAPATSWSEWVKET